MATPIYLTNVETTPYDSTQDRTVTDGLIRDARAAATSSGAVAIIADAVNAGTEIRFEGNLTNFPFIAWYAERIAAEVTISGAITCTIYGKISVSTVNARLRVKIWKRTAGGSEVDTFIGQGDASSALTTTTALQTITITPAVAVTLAPEERLIIRTYAIPAAGQTMGVGTVTHYVHGTVANSGEAKISFTETVTFLPNQTTLYPRVTTVNGISGFKDLLTTAGVAGPVTAVTTVQASESQWTDGTAGPAIAWISPRFQKGFTLRPVAGSWLSATRGLESNAAANVTPRIKLARWRNGVETEFLNVRHPTVEFATVAGNITLNTGHSQITQIDFLPDDRLVYRLFVTNSASNALGAGNTASVQYDEGLTSLTLLQTSIFKAEGDPADPATIPDGLPMTGVGN